MTDVFEVLFWLGISWLAYVYVGYPAVLWLLGLFRSFYLTPVDGDLPRVSVLLAARNEQEDIGWKISETLAWDYPAERFELLVASDASEDRTDEILRQVKDPRFKFACLEERKGKNEALNYLNALAKGDLLFFSDANSHIEPGCLRRMVRHFSDPRVGCVTGSERTFREGDENVVKIGIQAFLGYESLVNNLEARLGSVLVCDGSIFCIRRSFFGTLQADLANDFELPVRIGAAGKMILFDPLAIAFEKATTSPIEEFHRKRRICGQGMLGYWRLRHDLKGFRLWQFFSRKLLRWLGPIPLTLILFSSVWLVSHPFYAAILFLQTIFYALTLIGWLRALHKQQASRVTSFPFYFVMVNIAALIGVFAGISGKRFSVWESPFQSRGRRNHGPLNSMTCVPLADGPKDQPCSASRECLRELRSEK